MTENIKTSDLYIEVELLGNVLHAGEAKVYQARIDSETDRKRQQDMRNRQASGYELGNQMGIVWAMHELYRAKTEADILKVKEQLENYKASQDANLAELVR